MPLAGGAADQRAGAARLRRARFLPRAARRARPPAAAAAGHHRRLVPGCARALGDAQGICCVCTLRRSVVRQKRKLASGP